MSLLLRLFWLWLRMLFMKRVKDPLAPTVLNMRVMPNDLDIYMHMNNGRYLTIMDLGRLHLLGVTGLLKVIKQKRWYPLLGSAKIHFIRPLTVFAKFKMTTQVVYWDEKWIYVEQKMLSKEKLCAVSMFKILFVDKKRKIVPKELMEFLPGIPEQIPIPPSVQYWQEAEKKHRETNGD